MAVAPVCCCLLCSRLMLSAATVCCCCRLLQLSSAAAAVGCCYRLLLLLLSATIDSRLASAELSCSVVAVSSLSLWRWNPSPCGDHHCSVAECVPPELCWTVQLTATAAVPGAAGAVLSPPSLLGRGGGGGVTAGRNRELADRAPSGPQQSICYSTLVPVLACPFVYVCVWVCMRVCWCVCVCVRVYACACLLLCACASTHVFMRACVREYIFACI